METTLPSSILNKRMNKSSIFHLLFGVISGFSILSFDKPQKIRSTVAKGINVSLDENGFQADAENLQRDWNEVLSDLNKSYDKLRNDFEAQKIG